MTGKTALTSLLGILFVAVPLSGRADSSDVSKIEEGPAVEGVIDPSKKEKQQSSKRNGRLRGTVEYKMEHGNGKGETEGQADNVQAADHPENWVKAGENSRGVVRWAPDKPVVDKGQINLRLLPGGKLPPTDIGQPTFNYKEVDYGDEGSPPPYFEFEQLNFKNSENTFGDGSMKKMEAWSNSMWKDPKRKFPDPIRDGADIYPDGWLTAPNESPISK